MDHITNYTSLIGDMIGPLIFEGPPFVGSSHVCGGGKQQMILSHALDKDISLIGFTSSYAWVTYNVMMVLPKHRTTFGGKNVP